MQPIFDVVVDVGNIKNALGVLSNSKEVKLEDQWQKQHFSIINVAITSLAQGSDEDLLEGLANKQKVKVHNLKKFLPISSNETFYSILICQFCEWISYYYSADQLPVPGEDNLHQDQYISKEDIITSSINGLITIYNYLPPSVPYKIWFYPITKEVININNKKSIKSPYELFRLLIESETIKLDTKVLKNICEFIFKIENPYNRLKPIYDNLISINKNTEIIEECKSGELNLLLEVFSAILPGNQFLEFINENKMIEFILNFLYIKRNCSENNFFNYFIKNLHFLPKWIKDISKSANDLVYLLIQLEYFFIALWERENKNLKEIKLKYTIIMAEFDRILNNTEESQLNLAVKLLDFYRKFVLSEKYVEIQFSLFESFNYINDKIRSAFSTKINELYVDLFIYLLEENPEHLVDFLFNHDHWEIITSVFDFNNLFNQGDFNNESNVKIMLKSFEFIYEYVKVYKLFDDLRQLFKLLIDNYNNLNVTLQEDTVENKIISEDKIAEVRVNLFYEFVLVFTEMIKLKQVDLIKFLLFPKINEVLVPIHNLQISYYNRLKIAQKLIEISTLVCVKKLYPIYSWFSVFLSSIYKRIAEFIENVEINNRIILVPSIRDKFIKRYCLCVLNLLIEKFKLSPNPHFLFAEGLTFALQITLAGAEVQFSVKDSEKSKNKVKQNVVKEEKCRENSLDNKVIITDVNRITLVIDKEEDESVTKLLESIFIRFQDLFSKLSTKKYLENQQYSLVFSLVNKYKYYIKQYCLNEDENQYITPSSMMQSSVSQTTDYYHGNDFDILSKKSSINLLFQFVALKLNRDQIKAFINLADIPEFISNEHMVYLRNNFLFSIDKLTVNEFNSIFQFLSLYRQLILPDKTEQECQDEQPSEEYLFYKENENLLIPVTTKIADHFLEKLLDLLQENQLNKNEVKELLNQLNYVLLFKTIAFRKLISLSADNVSPMDIFHRLSKDFEEEIITNSYTMTAITKLSSRIRFIRSKYFYVRKTASELLDLFLAPLPDEWSSKSLPEKLHERYFRLYEFISNFPENQTMKNQFTRDFSFSEALFEYNKPVEMLVSLELRHEMELQFKLKLIECYEEYLLLLKENNIHEIQIQGSQIPCKYLFKKSYSIEQIRERRSIIIKLLSRLHVANTPASDTRSARTNIHFKIRSLLEKEKQFENEFDENMKKVRKKQYSIRLLSNLFDCILSCSNGFSGCYEPNGVHCEKPVQLGFQHNGGIISLSTADHTKNKHPANSDLDLNAIVSNEYQRVETFENEFENIEFTLIEQGMYIWKLYGKRTDANFDSSNIFILFFYHLLRSKLVPAIILPENLPNPSIFSKLANVIPAEYKNIPVLHKNPFFSTDPLPNYFDATLEEIKASSLMLTEQNMREIVSQVQFADIEILFSTLPVSVNPKEISEEVKPIAKKEENLQKDFGSMIVADCIDLLRKNYSKKFPFPVDCLGKQIKEFIENILLNKEFNKNVILLGIDLALLKPVRRAKKNQVQLESQEKQELADVICDLVENQFNSIYYEPSYITSLFHSNLFLFLQLKNHIFLLKRKNNLPNEYFHCKSPEAAQKIIKNLYDLIIGLISKNIKYYNINEFDKLTKTKIITFIYGNEDSVWRTRGGRSGDESLASFLSLIDEKDSNSLFTVSDDAKLPHFGHPTFPGFVVFNHLVETLPSSLDPSCLTIQSFQGKHIIGYAIGDFYSPTGYEIITAWTHDYWRGLHIAAGLYWKIMTALYFHHPSCSYLQFDILSGSYSSIMSSSSVFSYIKKVEKFVIVKREASHASEYFDVASNTTVTEQFEHLNVRVRALVGFYKFSRSKITWASLIAILGISSLSLLLFFRNRIK